MVGENILIRLLHDWRGYYKWLTLSVLLTVGSVTGSLLIPFLSAGLINQGIMAGNNDYLSEYGFLMLLAAILFGICEIVNTAIAVRFSEETAHYLRTEGFEQIQKFSYSNLDRFRASDLLVRLTTDIQNIKMGVQQGIMNIVKAPLMLVVSIIALWLTAPQFLWIAVILLIMLGIIQYLYLTSVAIAYNQRQTRYDALNKVLRESLVGIRVVKAFVRQGLENKRFSNSAEELRQAAVKPQYHYALLIPSLFFVSYLGIAGVYYIGGLSILEGTGLNIGIVTAAMQYFTLIITPLFILGTVMPFLTSGKESLNRVYQLIDEMPDIKENEVPILVDVNEIKGRVVFENVSFGYSDQSKVVKNINLTIEAGEKVGFLGATGSGKSTLVNLIPRFYDVKEGKITIDGYDIQDLPLKTLRHLVGVCLQESYLFSGTVQENIIMGVPNATYDDMLLASKAADAHEFINAIPEQYESHVARKGADFSGGQRQRISIARSLILKPKILILDDSTSACDVATEARIQDEVDVLMKDSTQLIVAQRISSVITADKIVLMDKGEIVAMGAHEKLLKTSALYQEIYNSQLKSGISGSKVRL